MKILDNNLFDGKAYFLINIFFLWNSVKIASDGILACKI